MHGSIDWNTGTSLYSAVFLQFEADTNACGSRPKSRFCGQRIATVCKRQGRRTRKAVRPRATGRAWVIACVHPGVPARLRVWRGRIAAVLASAAPGSSGCSDASAGARPGSDGRKQTQSQLQQRPHQQQQQRHASRGPRGRKEMGDSPGSSGSGRPGHSQCACTITGRQPWSNGLAHTHIRPSSQADSSLVAEALLVVLQR